MDCAFIGFGNAAYGIASGLKASGIRQIAFYKHRDVPPFSGLLAERVASAGAVYVPGYAELAASAHAVFSVVVGSAAVAVAKSIAPYLTSGHLYVDMNTASPAAKKEAAAIVEATGARYADAVIMGPVEALGHTVPVLASGSGAADFFRTFAPLGMDITVLEGEAGDAAAVKLLRSVFQKGMMCLFTEMLLAAKQCGVEDVLVSSVSATFDGVPLTTMAGRMVPKAVGNAERMAVEMREVESALKSMGLPSFMAGACAEAFTWCGDLDLAKSSCKDIDDALISVQEGLRRAAGQ